MFYDLITAAREFVREFKRLRWKRQRARQIHLPF
jgi:hypothetical protein